MLDELKKENEKKFAKIQEKEEFLRKEKFFKSVENKKKREKKDEDIQKLLKEQEEELKMLEEKFNEEDEIRKINEMKRKEMEENKIQDKQLKRNIKEDEIKKILDENFSNHIKVLEDRQKHVSFRESKRRNIIEEKRMEGLYKSQERVHQNKIKIIKSGKEWEEKQHKHKEVNKNLQKF